jgi:hypothetical protein
MIFGFDFFLNKFIFSFRLAGGGITFLFNFKVAFRLAGWALLFAGPKSKQ